MRQDTSTINTACVYRHIRPDTNEVFYVGIGSTLKRPYQKDGHNRFWESIVKKCNGKYKVDVLFEDLTWEDACAKEIEFIALYGRRNPNKGTLCNLTDGGDGSVGLITTEETKKKLVAALRRRGPISEHTRKLLSEGKLGKNNPQYGKKTSEETKQKQIAKRLGTRRSAEAKRNISESLRGRQVSIETRRLLSEINTGSKHPQYGKPKPKDVREKISKAHIGVPLSEKHIEGIREAARKRRGIPMKEEFRKKISETLRNQRPGRRIINSLTGEIYLNTRDLFNRCFRTHGAARSAVYRKNSPYKFID